MYFADLHPGDGAANEAGVVPALIRAVEGAEVIVHAAGLTRARDEAAFNAVNVAGTCAVVAAANRCGARLVYLSSQAAIGPGTIDRPACDTDAPRPVNAYGRSKLAAERVLHLGRVISRPPPGGRPALPGRTRFCRTPSKTTSTTTGSPTGSTKDMGNSKLR